MKDDIVKPPNEAAKSAVANESVQKKEALDKPQEAKTTEPVVDKPVKSAETTKPGEKQKLDQSSSNKKPTSNAPKAAIGVALVVFILLAGLAVYSQVK